MFKNKIKANRDINFYHGILYACKNLILNKDEIELIKKWKIKDVTDKLENKNYFIEFKPEDNKKDLASNQEELIPKEVNFIDFIFEFVNKNQMEIISKSNNYFLPDLEQFYTLISTEIKKSRDEVILKTNLFSSNNKLVGLITKTSIYIVLLGQSLNLKKELIITLLKANFLLEIYYTIHPMKLTQNKINPSDLNFKFLNDHIKQGYLKGKKMFKVPSNITNLILLHHEHVDGSGLLGLDKTKIPKLANILCLIQEFFYLSSGFLKNYFPTFSLHKAILIVIKNRNKFFSEVLKAFLSINPFYPLGEIIKIRDSNKNENKLSLVVKASRSYQLPLVKLIDPQNSIDESQAAIDLSNNSNYKILGSIEYSNQKSIILSKFAQKKSIIFE